MAYDYDIICIGMGPAGMAVAAMAASMGLKVCGIERHKIGGECMNVGCIPSKSLLKMAQRRHTAARLLEQIEGSEAILAALPSPFERVRKHVDFIGENKTMGMFDKVDLVVGQGAARFTGRRQVTVGERTISGRRIFICTGTRPMLPPISGLAEADPLTNESMFSLNAVPPSLVVLGGGAIAVEMAQAFARLGSAVSIIIRGERLMRRVVAKEATDVLEQCLESEGITIRRNTEVNCVETDPEGGHRLHLSNDEVISSSRILVALGREFNLQGLGLEEAAVRYDAKGGIVVDRYLRTSNKAILAVGDINGFAQFSHAAMHQGMIALMNCMLPWPMRRDYRRFVVPWTMFTQPQVSHVGPSEEQLRERRIKFGSSAESVGQIR
ncbi:MAG: NAD(P)/FAD-dependent oxidoreductase [Planctomycetota bacterium]|nr:MAG: NAD(P)/FAD-dependent oxidoreductase [Planctomycetota bacterium]